MEAKTINKYKNKSVSALKKTAKLYFNRFIRLRDTDENGFGYCISSGQLLKYGTENCQAGHYFPGTVSQLEFNEYNVNLQGKSDNYFKSGNQLEYRRRLIDKIGIERVFELEMIAAQAKRVNYKHDRFFLIETIEKYKAKCKYLLENKNFT